jgi:hypothetical protein
VTVLAVHPLNQQCEARAKATGQRCERRVVGGSVCYVHGGNARQVKAKREERVLVAELEAQAAAQAVAVRREPEELLLDALHDTNAVLARIKADLHGGVVNPILLKLCGDWLDRLGRLGKVVVDGDLSEKLHRRVGWMAQDRAAQLWGMLAAVLRSAPLTAQDRLLLWNSIPTAARLVADGDEPLRLSPQEVRLFTDELEVAAAKEKALADGLPWGEDSSESDEELDEVGALVSLRSFDSDGFRL